MKKIIINENQFKTLLRMKITPTSLKDTRYVVDPGKVKVIKKFLDTGEKIGEPRRYWGFVKGNTQEESPSGGMSLTPCFGQKDALGNIVKTIMKDDMLDLLMHEYSTIYPDEEQRKRFLTKTMEDWYNNKIRNFGGLSANYFE